MSSGRFRFLAIGLLAVFSSMLFADDEARSVTDARVTELLEEYCVSCHKGRKPKGDVRLDQFQAKADFFADIETTQKIVDVLSRGEMPPKKKEQPTKDERVELAHVLGAYVGEYLRKNKTMQPVVMRRLNRYEYSNSVRDLLSLRGDIYPLPEKCIRESKPYFDPASGRFPDRMNVGNRTLGKFQVERQMLSGVVPFAMDLQSEHGFNNRGDELSVPPILLESFLKLGHSVLHSPELDAYCTDFGGIFRGVDEKAKISNDDRVKKDLEIARARLAKILERAFRTSVETETLERYFRFFEARYRATKSFPAAMKAVLSAVIASPKFLYLVEAKHGEEPIRSLDDYEIAARLSFFLWSTLPDEPLLALARDGKLQDRSVLVKEVRRMLKDKRSRSLASNFARQWLRLDQLITAVPDMKRFPRYYSRIGCEYWKFGLQMMVEPLLLFESILVEDRSILLLVDSDYSYRSDELHRWYSSPKPFGGRGEGNRFNTFRQDFKRRELTDRREGGVITTAAVMTMTSAPLRTQPITRGAWVTTVIFNRPPAPPPDDIPEIESDPRELAKKGLTLRERLQEHRLNDACTSCHQKIDPFGFALENYDAVGRWRDKYESGREIDASGKLLDGTSFDDIVSLKDALLRKPKIFIRAFSEHMLSYSLGRELTFADTPAIDKIVETVHADGGCFSTLIVALTTSRPFLSKTNQEPKR